MVTARSLCGVLRPRSSAGSRHLLLVAMLLFGLVYAHGVSAEGVAGHLSPASTTAVAAADVQLADGEPGAVFHGPRAKPGKATGHHDDEHDTSHPVQECVPGQPQQGPELEAPCVSPRFDGTAFATQPLDGPARSGDGSDPPWLRDITTSPVLQI
jgi:hypothetical protein